MKFSNPSPETSSIRDMTAEGQGIANLPGKRVFIQGALTGETVTFVRRRRKRGYDEAELIAVEERSTDRTDPRCEYFGRCGGCTLQHLDSASQIRLKESVLSQNLQRIGGVQAEQQLPPMTGPVWGYRRRARLAVRDVPGKGRVLVGFRERTKAYVTDMLDCQTLRPEAARLIAPLSELIGQLSLRSRLPQVEIAVADNAVVLVIRALDEPSDADRTALRAFRDAFRVSILLQRSDGRGPEPLDPGQDQVDLYYELPQFALRIGFGPTDFIQVNEEINRRLIVQALQLLEPQSSDRILDLYCGVGNFSLPLAGRAAVVVGIDLESAMIQRAQRNARDNGIDNVQFRVADLAGRDASTALAGESFDGVLLDPPRSGAAAVMGAIAAAGPRRIVYVSCHPATLARDAGQFVREHGYRLAAAGIMDMFPHTSHVESIAVFDRS